MKTQEDDLAATLAEIPETAVDGSMLLLAGVLLQIAGQLQVAAVTVKRGAHLEATIKEMEGMRQALTAMGARLKVSVDIADAVIEKAKAFARAIEEERPR